MKKLFAILMSIMMIACFMPTMAFAAGTLSSIAITTAPTKTVYTAGENFEKAGMVVTATYSDTTTAVVTDNVTVTDGNNLTAGKTSVTISYEEGGVTKTVDQTITVNEASATKTLSSIAITTAPTKTVYTAGENFEKAGMVVTATYSDTTTAVVTDNVTVTDGNNLTAGKTSVTISYEEGGVTKTVDQTITVKAKSSGSGGGGGSYRPTTPTQSTVDKAKAESKEAISKAASANKYDEAEQAEVKKIVDKANADIKNAKTEAEVKAIQEAAQAEIDKILTTEEKAQIAAAGNVEKKDFKVKSKAAKLNGKRAIRLTWTAPEGMKIDGYEIFRSTKKNSGYGTEPYFTTTKTSYTNNKELKSGNTYYYKVRAFVIINGEKVYTDFSLKAWRSLK